LSTYLLIPDQHAHPDHNNDRADWVGELLVDLKPDVVVNMGDAADMASLSDYDKGKRSFHGRAYKKDIEAHLDFQERMWAPLRRQKKKLPRRIVLEGNHEHRIERCLDRNPELEGAIGFSDYDFDSYYDTVVRYKGGTPGIIELDGILFSHFFPAGVSGRPLGGERPGHSLLNKNGMSSVQSHIHIFDYATRRTVAEKTLNGLVCGCYQDYINDWAGVLGRMWKPGIAILRDVHDGEFDLQWIGLNALRSEYSNDTE